MICCNIDTGNTPEIGQIIEALKTSNGIVPDSSRGSSWDSYTIISHRENSNRNPRMRHRKQILEEAKSIFVFKLQLVDGKVV